MRKFPWIASLFGFLSLGACSDDPEPYVYDGPPIDGPFVITVSDKLAVCTNAAGAETVRETREPHHSIIDVKQREDSLHDLAHGDEWIANFSTAFGFEFGDIEGVDLDLDSRHPEINYVREGAETELGGKVVVTGSITADALHLTSSDTFPNGPDTCTLSSTLNGYPALIADPAALEGVYSATANVGEYGCPAPDGVARAVETDMVVVNEPDGNILVDVGGMRIFMPPPNAEGIVSFEGLLAEGDPHGGGNVTGTVSGVLTTSSVDLAVRYTFAQAEAGCGAQTQIVASKQLPAPDTDEMKNVRAIFLLAD